MSHFDITRSNNNYIVLKKEYLFLKDYTYSFSKNLMEEIITFKKITVKFAFKK